MRGLIFDLDDTLYAREQFVHSGFAEVAQHVEKRYGVSSLKALISLREAAHFGRRGSEFQVLCDQHGLSQKLVPELVEVFRRHAPTLTMSDDAVEMLVAARAQGWRTAVLTNGLPRVQRLKISALNIARLVDHVVFAAEFAPRGKPAAAPFLEALRRLGVLARRCVCVGDDLTCDIAGARVLGISTIRVTTHVTRHTHHAREADAVTDWLGDIPTLAEVLLKGTAANVA